MADDGVPEWMLSIEERNDRIDARVALKMRTQGARMNAAHDVAVASLRAIAVLVEQMDDDDPDRRQRAAIAVLGHVPKPPAEVVAALLAAPEQPLEGVELTRRAKMAVAIIAALGQGDPDDEPGRP